MVVNFELEAAGIQDFLVKLTIVLYDLKNAEKLITENHLINIIKLIYAIE